MGGSWTRAADFLLILGPLKGLIRANQEQCSLHSPAIPHLQVLHGATLSTKALSSGQQS